MFRQTQVTSETTLAGWPLPGCSGLKSEGVFEQGVCLAHPVPDDLTLVLEVEEVVLEPAEFEAEEASEVDVEPCPVAGVLLADFEAPGRAHVGLEPFCSVLPIVVAFEANLYGLPEDEVGLVRIPDRKVEGIIREELDSPVRSKVILDVLLDFFEGGVIVGVKLGGRCFLLGVELLLEGDSLGGLKEGLSLDTILAAKFGKLAKKP